MKSLSLTTLTCCVLVAWLVNSSYAIKPFTDVTEKAGLKGVGGGYAAWADYNGDGWVDLAVDGQLWRNDKGRFTRTKISLGSSGVWGDVDNDGDLDYFSMTGQVYRNEGGKTFTAIPKAIPAMPRAAMTSTWCDVNGDGFIDLYITGYEGGGYHPDFLYLNQQNGTFKIVFRGPATPGRGVTVCDYDEDGDIDIYVSNYRLVPNALWRNNGKGKFDNVAKAAKVDGDGGLGAWGHTIGSSWGDFDNDGHIDLFVGNFSHPPAYQDRPKFYKNLGPKKGWTFSDLSSKAGLHWQESYASPALADFDNDGRLDLFFTTVYPGDRSVMYRNKGNWKFDNVTAAVKVNRPRTYQACWADFDNDGYMDILNGGRLYRNPGGKNRWLKVRLAGDGKVNRTAIGAQVRIQLGKQTLTRHVESATGQGNQNDLTLHFGLGQQVKPVDLQIRWPNGSRQTVKGVKTNSVVTVKKK